MEVNKVSGNKKQSTLPSHLSDHNMIYRSFIDTVPYCKFSYAVSNLTSWFNNIFFGFAKFSCEVINKFVFSLSLNATGSDRISLTVLNVTLPYSLDAITCIINKSLGSGQFPTRWITAIVKLLPKNGSVQTVKDLRPLGLLPIL